VIEGPTLISEALDAGIEILEQYVRADYFEFMAPGLQTHELEVHTFNSVSNTDSPRGVLAVCRIPEQTSLSFTANDWLMVLHEVSDPGNLGTLVRSAEAAGASGVVLVGSTVDPWSPKVLRASAGGMFHVPMWQVNSLDVLHDAGIRLIGTTSHANIGAGGAVSLYDTDFTGLLGIVVGNEAHGLDPSASVDAWLTIPHVGRSESLNVAMAGTVIAMHVSKVRLG
jgi:RNA methyltransferase, TrmH family